MIPGYFYLRQRIPLIIYVIYRLSEWSGINPRHKKRIMTGAVLIVAAYLAVCVVGLWGKIPLSRVFPYDWSYQAIITWGGFFLLLYTALVRKTGDHPYAFNLAFQSVVAAGWLHEISYYHPVSMFISSNAVFGVNSQIIALVLVAYELKRKRFKATPELYVTIIFYTVFSLVVAKDVNIFRRVLWVYRIPSVLIFMALAEGVGLKEKRESAIKVLHVWNTAGVAGNIAQKMDELYSTESKVLMRAAGDPFGQTIKGVNYGRAAKFLFWVAVHIPKYDIIHVHSLEKSIPWIKIILPWKPLFIHYHGTNIRGLWDEQKKYWRWADEIFVSTPDLLEGAPEGVTYIPNVVNEKLLDSILILAHDFKIGYALHDNRGANEEARKFAQTHSYEIIEYSRTLTEGLSHRDFIQKLASYHAYIDVKRDFPGYGDGEILRAHSLTGLEALYLGLKVIRWDGELIEGFPKRHRAENVTATLYEIYGGYVK